LVIIEFINVTSFHQKPSRKTCEDAQARAAVLEFRCCATQRITKPTMLWPQKKHISKTWEKLCQFRETVVQERQVCFHTDAFRFITSDSFCSLGPFVRRFQCQEPTVIDALVWNIVSGARSVSIQATEC